MMNVVLTILAESMPTLLGMLLLAFFLQARLHREITGVRQDVAQMEIGLRQEMGQMEVGLRQDVGQMETGLRQDMGQMETRLRQEMRQMETGLRRDMGQMETGLRKELAGHGERLARIEQRLFPGPPAAGPPRDSEE